MKNTLLLIAMAFFASNCIAQNKDNDGSVPLSKSYNLYALTNGWKTYNDKSGYTVMFPKNIKDGGSTVSGIHYFDGIEISVETDCYNKSTNLEDALTKWYNSTVAEINTSVYTDVNKQHNANSFLIVKKDKDGIYYEKCIMGDHCFYTLSFSVDNSNLKRLSEHDADAILALFVTSKKTH